MLAAAAALTLDPARTLELLHHAVFGLFAAVSVGRAASAAMTLNRRAAAHRLQDCDLPAYTVLAPLYREPHMVGELISALSRLDYPADKLQVLILLEAGDHHTIAAARETCVNGWATPVICAPGHPRTKPRACNIGLKLARGDLVVIYDAEDQPHPAQLREAAEQFAACAADVACLQAPLRIHHTGCLMQRQFALEYAALFEIVLPALARLGGPFPLGGTSNHFRKEALVGVGGWDAFNVTEDADLGFRLASRGYRLGVLEAPTYETAPDRLGLWIRQRGRWIKGYMQTWGVHTRSPLRRRPRQMLILTLTVGVAIASAFLHGPACLWIAIELLIWAVGHGQPDGMILDAVLLVGGWCSALGAMALGARRAGVRMSVRDALTAPLYWTLPTPAAVYALWQLARRPFHWDKTPHRPVPQTMKP